MKAHPFQNFTYGKEGKYILVCHRVCNYATWSITINDKFDHKKFGFSVNRYNAFDLFDDETIDLTYEEVDLEFDGGGGSDVMLFKLLSADGECIDV